MREIPPTHIIRGEDPGLTLADLKEAWAYRELLLLFCWRDIKLRYNQTSIGVTWTILQPLLSTGIFTILFGKLANIPSEGLPYALFNYSGFIPWLLFVNCVGRSSNSLVDSSFLMSKVYFPRILLPIGSLMPSVVDFAIGMSALVPLCLYYRTLPPFSCLITVPLLTCLTVVLALGISLFLSALNVHLRDIGNLIPFALQIAMWLTPVTYPLSLVPEKYRMWAYLNPMAGLIEAYRSALLERPWDFHALGYTAAVALFMFTLGFYYFHRVERNFADVV